MPDVSDDEIKHWLSEARSLHWGDVDQTRHVIKQACGCEKRSDPPTRGLSAALGLMLLSVWIGVNLHDRLSFLLIP